LAKAAAAETPEGAQAKEELREVLFTLMEGVRWVATALLPVLPFKMPEVFSQLGISAPAEMGALRDLRWGTHEFQPTEPKPLYPRLERPKEEGAEEVKPAAAKPSKDSKKGAPAAH
jgi:methionyl-tRNA synthetase